MKVEEYKANRVYPSCREYDTDLTDIKDVAQKFGETNDRVKLYGDAGDLIAIAVWPIGSKIYVYSTEAKILDAWSSSFQR